MVNPKVSEVMTHFVAVLYPEDTVHQAAKRLARNRISGAPVVEDGRVIGIVSESDLIHSGMPPVPVDRGPSVLGALPRKGGAKPGAYKHRRVVSDIMSTLVIQVPPETSVWRAASIMEAKGIKRLPVVDEDGYLVGIVSRADVLRAMARDDNQLRDEVVESIGLLGEETVVDLQVEVHEGIVTLRGDADRRTTKYLALKLASRTPGIVEVIDKLNFDSDDTKIKLSTDLDPRENWQSERAVEAHR